MKKSLVLLAAAFLIGACVSQAERTPTPKPVLVEPLPVNTPTSKIGCETVKAEPTPTPGADSYFPPVNASDFSFGPTDAPVVIVEYCDFQSEGCLTMAKIIGQLMRERNDLRFIFRLLPLTDVLDKSERSARAALAAAEQGKFWEMYDLLFTRHAEWKNLKPTAFDAWLLRESAVLGLDAEKFKAAINSVETGTRLQSMREDAKNLGIPAVPLLLVNGALQPSYLLNYQSLHDAIGLIVLGKKQFTQCPPFDVNPLKQYIATLRTEKGDIVIQLFPDKAPLAVNSFLFLARQGWYDGVSFHRVIPGFVAQAGDPSGTGRGNPGYLFDTEISDLKFDQPGRVGMANNGPNANGSQFFIAFAPAPHLDGSFTVFGQVIRGLEVAEKLTPRDPQEGGILPPGDKILGVEVEER
ncbi:MAG: peptidylprolyl isomerase [Chloroflexi bacterium]|nr:peptidylprolyl isomerase [Chloroflexota bacterium]